MIRERYRVEGSVYKRWVRKAIGQEWYEWCEQSADDLVYDIAQGTCNAEDLPIAIRKKCDEAKPNGFYVCEWPVDE